jgi:hypothetical protein
MDSPNPNATDTEAKPRAELEAEPHVELPSPPEAESTSYVNEKIRKAYERVKLWGQNARESYNRSPRLQKVSYQGKFLPAFWTVAAIFSLLVNIVLIAVIISFGRNFFALKALVADGLVNGLSENLALMDKAHIVATIPVQTTVQLQDNLPVVFDVPLKEDTQVTLSRATVVDATTYINGSLVPLNVTLPAGTPMQLNLDMTIPVSQSVPVDLTVPVSLLVPIDLAVDQTDLHQSIVGLQSAIEPYEAVLGSSFNTADDISLCKPWWSGWLCDILFGKP